jgi:DNA gyrase subunit A
MRSSRCPCSAAFDATPQEREDYLRAAPWKEGEREVTLAPERMAEFEAAEEFILTVTANGYGKRTSAYEYRPHQSRRPGHHQHRHLRPQRPRRGELPGHNGEQLMLVTDQAKLIRTTVGDIRIAGRNTQGVTIFKVAPGEHVVSAARIEESEDEAEVVVDVEDPQLSASDGAIGGDAEA